MNDDLFMNMLVIEASIATCAHSVTTPDFRFGENGHIFGVAPKILSQIVDAASSWVLNPQFVNKGGLLWHGKKRKLQRKLMIA